MKHIAKKLIIQRLNAKVRKLLSTNEITIIVVTGSVGKTSTKVAIGKVLSATRKVLYTEDSYNSDIGIPLSLFNLEVPQNLWNPSGWKKIFAKIDSQISNYRYDTVILEIAEDELKMQKVLHLLKPQISVLCEVSLAHTAVMKDIGTILHSAWQIASTAETIFYNADNTLIRKKAYKTGTIGFGLNHGEARFEHITRTKKGTLKAKLKIGRNSKFVSTQLVGKQNLYSLLAAASVANFLEVPFQAICFELEQIKPVKGRMNLLPGLNNSTLIDDSYNAASPVGVVAAIDTLTEFSGRKIAVLGQMNELGDLSASEHEKVGEYSAPRVDLLVTIGKDSKNYLAPAAAHAGLEKDSIKSFHTPYEAGHYLKNIVQKTDTVLIKGSQNGVFSEEVTRILLDPKADPSKVLIRQSKFWRRKKKKAFTS